MDEMAFISLSAIPSVRVFFLFFNDYLSGEKPVIGLLGIMIGAFALTVGIVSSLGVTQEAKETYTILYLKNGSIINCANDFAENNFGTGSCIQNNMNTRYNKDLVNFYSTYQVIKTYQYGKLIKIENNTGDE